MRLFRLKSQRQRARLSMMLVLVIAAVVGALNANARPVQQEEMMRPRCSYQRFCTTILSYTLGVIALMTGAMHTASASTHRFTGPAAASTLAAYFAPAKPDSFVLIEHETFE